MLSLYGQRSHLDYHFCFALVHKADIKHEKCNIVLHSLQFTSVINDYFNPLTAKLFNLNFYPLEIVSR